MLYIVGGGVIFFILPHSILYNKLFKFLAEAKFF